MTISAIKQQIKNPQRVSFFVDGKYSFSLSFSEMLEYKLKVGLELNEADIKRLTKVSADGKLKARALEWLLSRPHSIKEFNDYLSRKKTDTDLIYNLSQEFIAKKYLNDEAFAKWWVETRRMSKNSSNRKLNLELRQKGIESEIINRQLKDTKYDELEALRAVVIKKSRLSKYKNDQQKFTAYLIGQGFHYSDIKQILNK